MHACRAAAEHVCCFTSIASGIAVWAMASGRPPGRLPPLGGTPAGGMAAGALPLKKLQPPRRRVGTPRKSADGQERAAWFYEQAKAAPPLKRPSSAGPARLAADRTTEQVGRTAAPTAKTPSRKPASPKRRAPNRGWGWWLPLLVLADLGLSWAGWLERYCTELEDDSASGSWDSDSASGSGSGSGSVSGSGSGTGSFSGLNATAFNNFNSSENRTETACERREQLLVLDSGSMGSSDASGSWADDESGSYDSACPPVVTDKELCCHSAGTPVAPWQIAIMAAW